MMLNLTLFISITLCVDASLFIHVKSEIILSEELFRVGTLSDSFEFAHDGMFFGFNLGVIVLQLHKFSQVEDLVLLDDTLLILVHEPEYLPRL